MWKQVATYLFTRFIVILVCTAHLLDTTLALSDKRLCADENCKEIISLGTGKINYRAGAEGIVSFKINAPIRIKSKSAGNDPSLWGIEVNGREGYAPKEYIRETKILVKSENLKYTVDVNSVNQAPVLSTSEKAVEQENTVESTTTTPLNVVPLESTEKPLENNSKENEIPAAATPVLSEIVDGTPIPIENSTFQNESDGVVENVEDKEGLEVAKKYQTNMDSEYDDEEDNELGDYVEDEVEEEVFKQKKPEETTNTTADIKNENFVAENEKQSTTITDEVVIEKQEQTGKVEDHKETDIPEMLQNVQASKTEEVHDESIQEPKVLSDMLEHHKVSENQAINEEAKQVIAQDSKIPNDDKSKENIESTKNYQKAEDVSMDQDINDSMEQSDTPISTKNLKQASMENNENKTTVEGIPSSDNINLNIQHIDPKEATNEGFNASENIPKDQILDDAKPTETPLNENVMEHNLNENEIHQQDLKTESASNEASTEQTTTPASFDSDYINSLYGNYEEFPVTTENPVAKETTENIASTEMPETVELPIESVENNADSKVIDNPKDMQVEEQINTRPYSPYNEVPTTTPSPVIEEYINPNDYYAQQYEAASTENHHQPSVPNSYEEPKTTMNYDSIPASTESSQKQTTSYEYDKQNTESSDSTKTAQAPQSTEEILNNEAVEQPNALPSSTPPSEESKENKGLFATIMGTVNNVWLGKNKRSENEEDNELDRILFANGHGQGEHKASEEDLQYCKQISPNGECPQSEQQHHHHYQQHHHESEYYQPSSSKSIFDNDFNIDTFLKALANKVLEISELLAFLVIAAVASLFFIFGYYCFCNSSREGALLSKLNQLESSLLASHKENAILKHNLMSTRQKLVSIEDNSFGSNDMVVSLKKELEEELMEKSRLQEQITVLQKELENAADAGIELNKIVSELLSNQTGDESIISSVEELQKQLNEQQNTILEINASLAEKSRENSELQLMIAEQNARYEAELANVQRDNDELEHEKGNLLTRLDELKTDYDKDITAALEGKNLEIRRLQNEIVDLTNKIENEHTKWQTSVAKIEALEECLKNVKKDPNVNITQVIDVANIKAQLIETQKKYKSLKERLEIEVDTKKIAENQLQVITEEVEKLKQDFNQSEKDKLEAQTRLEVLSNYFKDKETQLQKELSLKEAMWLKQQGETTTTVDRVTAMQEEIQSLKSQNDSLRAEIEAQIAAHKAQTGTLENRAHETWLAARQSDRRYEEARAEATALRRQLTALAGGNVNEANKPSAGTAGLSDELAQAPSPIHMESPGSPMLGRLPPPPFLPPPFMGPPPPFMGMHPPPPPFVPPGEMRPAPLGRIMSPPPPPQRSGRFSPQHLDYEDYLDYEGNNTWHRHTYSPPPRTYRSLSPTDSRYNYGTERDLMSTYDTETDFSPPPSPRESRRRGGHSSERIDNKSPYGTTKKINSSKGPLSSGSEKSFNTPPHHNQQHHHQDSKTKKGNSTAASGVGSGGKQLV